MIDSHSPRTTSVHSVGIIVNDGGASWLRSDRLAGTVSPSAYMIDAVGLGVFALVAREYACSSLGYG
jgi:hypothetical protein